MKFGRDMRFALGLEMLIIVIIQIVFDLGTIQSVIYGIFIGIGSVFLGMALFPEPQGYDAKLEKEGSE